MNLKLFSAGELDLISVSTFEIEIQMNLPTSSAECWSNAGWNIHQQRVWSSAHTRFSQYSFATGLANRQLPWDGADTGRATASTPPPEASERGEVRTLRDIVRGTSYAGTSAGEHGMNSQVSSTVPRRLLFKRFSDDVGGMSCPTNNVGDERKRVKAEQMGKVVFKQECIATCHCHDYYHLPFSALYTPARLYDISGLVPHGDYTPFERKAAGTNGLSSFFVNDAPDALQVNRFGHILIGNRTGEGLSDKQVPLDFERRMLLNVRTSDGDSPRKPSADYYTAGYSPDRCVYRVESPILGRKSVDVLHTWDVFEDYVPGIKCWYLGGARANAARGYTLKYSEVDVFVSNFNDLQMEQMKLFLYRKHIKQSLPLEKPNLCHDQVELDCALSRYITMSISSNTNKNLERRSFHVCSTDKGNLGGHQATKSPHADSQVAETVYTFYVTDGQPRSLARMTEFIMVVNVFVRRCHALEDMKCSEVRDIHRIVFALASLETNEFEVMKCAYIPSLEYCTCYIQKPVGTVCARVPGQCYKDKMIHTGTKCMTQLKQGDPKWMPLLEPGKGYYTYGEPNKCFRITTKGQMHLRGREVPSNFGQLMCEVKQACEIVETSVSTILRWMATSNVNEGFFTLKHMTVLEKHHFPSLKTLAFREVLQGFGCHNVYAFKYRTVAEINRKSQMACFYGSNRRALKGIQKIERPLYIVHKNSYEPYSLF